MTEMWTTVPTASKGGMSRTSSLTSLNSVNYVGTLSLPDKLNVYHDIYNNEI